MNTEKKYVMIVTSEDERYKSGEKDLSFFGDHPWEGELVEIVFGNSFEELMGDGHNEGLFQQTYDVITGKKLSCGSLNPDTPREEIEMWEKDNKTWKYVVKSIVNNLGWNLTINEDNIFAFDRNIGFHRNIGFAIEADKFINLCKKISEIYLNFDASHETYLWLDDRGHGMNGAPYDMSDVYDSIKEYEGKIKILRDTLEAYLVKYE